MTGTVQKSSRYASALENIRQNLIDAETIEEGDDTSPEEMVALVVECIQDILLGLDPRGGAEFLRDLAALVEVHGE